MAASPRWKVFNPQGEYVASCKHVEDAAAIVSSYGEGATIRDGYTTRSIMWTEGKEKQPAGESYDFVHAVVTGRARERAQARQAARV